MLPVWSICLGAFPLRSLLALTHSIKSREGEEAPLPSFSHVAKGQVHFPPSKLSPVSTLRRGRQCRSVMEYIQKAGSILQRQFYFYISCNRMKCLTCLHAGCPVHTGSFWTHENFTKLRLKVTTIFISPLLLFSMSSVISFIHNPF